MKHDHYGTSMILLRTLIPKQQHQRDSTHASNRTAANHAKRTMARISLDSKLHQEYCHTWPSQKTSPSPSACTSFCSRSCSHRQSFKGQLCTQVDSDLLAHRNPENAHHLSGIVSDCVQYRRPGRPEARAEDQSTELKRTALWKQKATLQSRT